MKKEYISPEAEIQKFTIYCDEKVSHLDGSGDGPGYGPGSGGDADNEF